MAYSTKWIQKNFEVAKQEAAKMMLHGLSPRDCAIYSMKNPSFFDIDLLECEFTKLCPDFPVPPSSVQEFQASKFFAMEILYRIAVALSRPDNKETMRTVNIGNKDTPGKNCVYIYTHKNAPPPVKTTIPKAVNGTMHMTLKQAQLLALRKMEQIIDLAATKGNYLIAPLAQNAFSGSVTEFHRELKAVGYEYSVAHLVKTINQSAYAGGHNLQYSEMHAAVVFAIASTAHFTDRTEAKAFVETTIKWYQFAGKKVDIRMLEVFAKYTSRGRLVRPAPEYLRQLCATKSQKMAEAMKYNSWERTSSDSKDIIDDSWDEFESAEEGSDQDDYKSALESTIDSN